MRCACLSILLLCAYAARATEFDADADRVLANLPDLSASSAPGHFGLDGESVAVGYDTCFRKWGATLDEYATINPSLTLDYGMLLTNRFGAGGIFTHHSDYSEILVNGIYAPKRNVRVKLAGGQLRTFSNDYSAFGRESDAVLQNNYLLDLRKYWDKNKLLSDVGFTAYTIDADGPDGADISALSGAAENLESDELAFGRQDGYMLNLSLRPSAQSKVELRREASDLTYYFDDGTRDEEQLVTSRIKYSQYFDNCMRFQGRYSASDSSDRLDLSIAQNNWSIGVSRAQDDSGGGTSVHIAYAVPLGRSSYRSSDCGSTLHSPRPFQPIVDAAITRPSVFPREPLARIESSSRVDLMTE